MTLVPRLRCPLQRTAKRGRVRMQSGHRRSCMSCARRSRTSWFAVSTRYTCAPSRRSGPHRAAPRRPAPARGPRSGPRETARALRAAPGVTASADNAPDDGARTRGAGATGSSSRGRRRVRRTLRRCLFCKAHSRSQRSARASALRRLRSSSAICLSRTSGGAATGPRLRGDLPNCPASRCRRQLVR